MNTQRNAHVVLSPPQYRWKIYWMPRDMKWHLYSTALSLAEALEVSRTDPGAVSLGKGSGV